MPIILYILLRKELYNLMLKHQNTISVTQAASLCGVGRTTVGYWIRSKKLRASRTGKKYVIPVQDLIFFLRSKGQKIPLQLKNENLNGPVFRSFQNCWQYYRDNSHGQNCQQCIAFKNKLQVCFSARNTGTLGCLGRCVTCLYYQDTYYPRLQFIHQLDTPAAVVKDLFFWAGNSQMAALCEVEEKDLVGIGVEQIVHPRSLEQVIAGAKKKALGAPGTQTNCRIYIKNSQVEKLAVKLSVFLLKEPQNAFLILAEPEPNSQAFQPQFHFDENSRS
jgi:excisionase family DNA binding protein